METVLPGWIDEVQGVDFTPEKELLIDLESWARDHGWEVSNGSTLPSELRQRTDVLIFRPNEERYLRVSVLPKSKGGSGRIRIDATKHQPFSHRVFDLVYQPRSQRWLVELAATPLIDDIRRQGWHLLEDFAFR
jgi:hypothetical protein